jgi:hypothetical protein
MTKVPGAHWHRLQPPTWRCSASAGETRAPSSHGLASAATELTFAVRTAGTPARNSAEFASADPYKRLARSGRGTRGHGRGPLAPDSSVNATSTVGFPPTVKDLAGVDDAQHR